MAEATTPASVSLTLTLSGGAALGAYEAGATAAVMEAVRVLRKRGENVSIDAFGGASAGALVAVFAAHAATNDIDPVWLLREAWVNRVSLDLLKGDGLESPLGFTTLTERIDELLDPRDEDGRPVHRLTGTDPHPVGLHVALTGLRGLHYPVRGLGVLNPVTAATYADWGGFTLQPGGGVRAIREPQGGSVLDHVLASAANPGAFAPRSVDRSNDVDGYAANGIEDLPESGRMWYTDGGTLQVEPIGRVLTAARKAREAAGRGVADRYVTLLIDPRSEMPSEATAWTGDERPSWIEGIARTLAIIPAQILYDDLRRVEKWNSRLSWAARLNETLAPHLTDDARADLAALLTQMKEERDELRIGAEHGNNTSDGDVPGDRDLLGEALDFVGGLQRKHAAEADVISPLLLADDEDVHVEGLLAGEIVGDFGGFLSRDLRESDFLLGYDCALAWLTENMSRLGMSDDTTEATLRAVKFRVPQRFQDNSHGKAELSDLPWTARLKLAQLAMRMTGVLAKDALGTLRSR